MQNKNQKTTSNVKAIFQAVLTCVVVAGLLFGTAGTFQWWNGWLFILAYCLLVISLTGFFSKSPAELVKKRITAQKKAKPWKSFFKRKAQNESRLCEV